MQFLRRSLLAGAFKFDARGSQVLPRSMLKHFRENLNSHQNSSVSDMAVVTGTSIGAGEWLELSPERRLEIVDPNAKEAPASLLHLLPQIAVTACTATEYFDKQAGIIRSPREQKEKRPAAILRARGKDRANASIASFFKKDREEEYHASFLPNSLLFHCATANPVFHHHRRSRRACPGAGRHKN